VDLERPRTGLVSVLPAASVPLSTGGSVPLLFAGLVDDAALFPPGNAPMGRALADHARHRKAWYADMVGPFVCTAGRLEEMRRELLSASFDAPLDLAVISGGPEAVDETLAAASLSPAVRLVCVDVPLPADGLAGGARRLVDALAGRLPREVTAYVEIPRADGWRLALESLSGTRHRAKVRTGGAVASAFPSDDELADMLLAAAHADVPVKCTAGLHNAVRHRDPQTGFEHHGFLNVLVAVWTCIRGGTRDEVVAALGERSGSVLATSLRSLDPAGAAAVRARFSSYGSCSIGEPVDDLLSLGLLHVPGRFV
jgi:hypothetical protein